MDRTVGAGEDGALLRARELRPFRARDLWGMYTQGVAFPGFHPSLSPYAPLVQGGALLRCLLRCSYEGQENYAGQAGLIRSLRMARSEVS